MVTLSPRHQASLVCVAWGRSPPMSQGASADVGLGTLIRAMFPSSRPASPLRRGAQLAALRAWKLERLLVLLCFLSNLQCGHQTFDLLGAPSGAGGGPPGMTLGSGGKQLFPGGGGGDVGSIGAVGGTGSLPQGDGGSTSGAGGNGGLPQGDAGSTATGGVGCVGPIQAPLCSANLCEPCSGAGVCPGSGHCNSGWCVECLNDNHCDADWHEVCDLATNRCARHCHLDRHCAAPSARSDRRCFPSTTNPPTPSLCVECRDHADCLDYEPICHFGRCVQCQADCHCAARFERDPDGLACINGRCKCREDQPEHCPPPWRCDSDGETIGECRRR